MERHPVGAGRGTCCVPGSHGRSAPRSVPFPRRAKARLAAHGIHAPFCAATAYAGGLRIGSAVPRSQTSRPAPQRGPDRTRHAVAWRGRARETRRRTTSAPLPRTTCGVDFLTALSRLVEVVGPSGAHRHRLHREARHHTQRPRKSPKSASTCSVLHRPPRRRGRITAKMSRNGHQPVARHQV